MINDFSLAVTTFGWGPHTTFLIFAFSVIIASIVFFIVISTTRLSVIKFHKKKKYRLEAIWAVFVAGILIWLYFLSFPWTPPSTFSNIINDVNTNNETLQIINITAGQWFWLIERMDNNYVDKIPKNESPSDNSTSFRSPVTILQNVPVKFVATSIDVNHGFGIFAGPEDGSPVLLQMQIIPGLQNEFYYTFNESGDFHIRCLEYCGYAHPYMTSSIHVVSEENHANKNSSSDNSTFKRSSNLKESEIVK